MIHYALRCADGHDFDGWFRGSAAFDRQVADGLLACPSCASTQVGRAMMAPRLSTGAPPPAAAAPARPAQEPPDGPARLPATTPPPAMPDQLRAVLQRMRHEVERRCDYVGPRFAEAARAMHAGSQPPRPIYGETTPGEAEALTDEGIEIASIPWLPRADG